MDGTINQTTFTRPESAKSHAVDIETEARDKLQKSLDKAGLLHEPGKNRSVKEIKRLSQNRNRFESEWSNNPGIDSETLQPPVIICGHGRTGTSALHYLLSSTDRFNTLTLEKTLFFTGSNRDPKKECAADSVSRWIEDIYERAPSLAHVHRHATSSPDEDSFVLEQTFNSPSFKCWAPIDDYQIWQSKQTLNPALVYLKRQLQYFQRIGQASQRKPWLLKCPFYFGCEVEIQQVFPDAILVFTHRTPIESLPSLYRYISLQHSLYTDALPSATAIVTESLLSTLNHLKWREQDRYDKVIDVCFASLAMKPMETANRVIALLSTLNSDLLGATACLQHPKALRKPDQACEDAHPIFCERKLTAFFREYRDWMNLSLSSPVIKAAPISEKKSSLGARRQRG